MASVHKIELPSGEARYIVHYRSPERKARKKTFRLRRDADRFRTEVENSLATGTFIDPGRGKVTVGEWATTWLDTKANVAQSTRDRYQGIIAEHIHPRWGTARLTDLTHAEIQAWIARLDLAPATVAKVHRVLSQMLKFAVKDGRLVRNPADGITLPRVTTTEMRFLTHAQVEDLADTCGQVFQPYALLVRFLAYTGLRWGEMAALRVSSIDFLRRRATIRESVTPVKGGLHFGPTKNHERRQVPIPKFLINDLAAHVTGKDPDDLVFIGPRGGPMRSQTFQRAALNAAAETLGLADDTGQTTREGEPIYTRHLHPHELRHTAASLAIAAGADVKVVQTMLGHKSATMTLDQYGHLFGDQLDTVMTALETARTMALVAPDRTVAADVLPITQEG